MKRADVIDNANIQAGDVVVGLASAGQATYETEYQASERERERDDRLRERRARRHVRERGRKGGRDTRRSGSRGGTCGPGSNTSNNNIISSCNYNKK